MASHFSDFDDEPTSTTPPVSAVTNPDGGKALNGMRSTTSERSRLAVATQTSFDDFDTDWDSDAPAASQRDASSYSSSMPDSRTTNARYSAPAVAKSSQNGHMDDSRLELSSAGDLANRARDLGLDDEIRGETQFGSNRQVRRPEGPNRSSGGMTLREFPATSSLERESPQMRPKSPTIDARLQEERHIALDESKYEGQMPPMPQVQYEPFSVEPPSHYQNYLYLLKYIHGLKILTAVHLLYAVIAVLFKIWFCVGGFLVAPVGFYAVHRLNRKLILVWGCGFLGDTFAEMIGALVFSSRAPDEGGGLVPTLIHMIVVLIRGGLIYLIYRFWTKLPENASEYFALFTSAPEPDRNDVV